MSGGLLTAKEAALLARRSVDTIWKWVERERLKPADRDWRGRHLFDPQAVLDAERGTRQRDRTGKSWRSLDTA